MIPDFHMLKHILKKKKKEIVEIVFDNFFSFSSNILKSMQKRSQ